jgi:hypothetical protein
MLAVFRVASILFLDFQIISLLGFFFAAWGDVKLPARNFMEKLSGLIDQ